MVIIMKKLIRIAIMNLKKRKAAAISLGILVFMLSLFLNTGIALLSNIQSLYDERAEILGEADIIIAEKFENYKDNHLTYLKQDDRVKEVELGEAIYSDNIKTLYAGGVINCPAYFWDISSDTKLCKAHMREEIESDSENAIYIPYSMKSFGFQLGDSMQIDVRGSKYDFVVAGFTESTNMGIGNVGAYKMYLGHKAYSDLFQECGSQIILGITCKDKTIVENVYDDLVLYISSEATSSGESRVAYAVSYNLSKLAYSSMGYMASFMLLGFAIIITMITILVIRHRIVNNIDENITAIGTLGALGYTGKQIVSVYAMEYILTTILGSILGTICSCGAVDTVGTLVADMSGLKWRSSFHMTVSITILLGIMCLITLICFQSAGKVHRYPPIVALSKGFETHEFTKNRFPLERIKGNIHVHLACKDVARSIKQNGMIAICIAGVTFATLMGFLLKDTFALKKTNILYMLGQELSDIGLDLAEQTDPEEFSKELMKMEGIRKVIYGEETMVYIGSQEVYLTVYEDFDQLETDCVYAGRFPQYDNEIVISGVMAEQLNVEMGDKVCVEANGYKSDYVVCGLSNAANNLGKVAKMSEDAYRKINPYAKANYLNVYIKEGYQAADVIDSIENKFGTSVSNMAVDTETKSGDKYDRIKQIADEKIAKLMRLYDVDSADYSIYIDNRIISGNTRKYVITNITDIFAGTQAAMNTFVVTFSNISLGILLSTLFVITLMVTLLVKTIIANGRTKYGILKAIGYTTPQLMLQIAMSLMPATVTGVLLGIFITGVMRNRLMGIVFKQIGVAHVEIAMPVAGISTIAFGLIVFTFSIAMLEAGRVRKISVYELLVE